MKILELRFKNLNSLYGEWVINLTYPEYVSNGIFELTGPTGAGKSTILDAICLALYGATPRLGKITKNANEIMSRQTGECYAEILFESQSGRFRCHWEQRRARKEPEGKLQDQEHQIADAKRGKLIETKKSLVEKVIEEKTGMDFAILEQITGTEIYSEISSRVHERQRDEREKLKLLHAETLGIMTLEPEQEKEIQQDLDTKQKLEIELVSKSTETRKAITWLNIKEGIEKEILNLKDKEAKLQMDTQAFKPERTKLEKALNAASLDGTYATLMTLREQQTNDLTALKTKEDALPKLETSTNKQTLSLKASEHLTLKAKEALKEKAPLIHKIRLLDQKVKEQAKSLSEASKAYRS